MTTKNYFKANSFRISDCAKNVVDYTIIKCHAMEFCYNQCPDEIVPDKSTSTTLRNTPLTYKHDSAGSFSITGNQLNRVYVRARDYAKLYWSTCSVLFRPDTGYNALTNFISLYTIIYYRFILF
jgi:hypothetical protein